MPEADDAAQSSSDEPTKSTVPDGPRNLVGAASPYRHISHADVTQPPQEFEKGDVVRYVDSDGQSHECKVDEAKEVCGSWKYRLREMTINEPLHKGGKYIRERKLEFCR